MILLPTQYPSSKGLIPINEMPHYHIVNAAKKWRREGGGPLMQRALDERVAYLDSLPDDEARIAATIGAKAAPIGHNLPPAEIRPVRTRDQIQAWINDLYGQARDILDGQPIENEGQAELVAKLKAMIVEAEAEAEKLRKAEAKEFDDGKKAVQEFYNPLIADTANQKGLTTRAIAACQALLTPWLVKVADELEAKKEAARRATDAAVEASQTLAQAADMSNLADAEVVEESVQVAKVAIRTEVAVEKERPRVDTGGFGRGTLLKDNWVATIEDEDAAMEWAWTYKRAEVIAYVTTLANAHVKATKGGAVGGFKIVNDRRAG